MRANTYVAIMAGGIGSRFWPASRETRPKQFLDIMGVGKSLIRLTYERFLHVCPSENIFIVTNKMYKDQVLEHIPELTDNQILCEPSRNNTGPCVAYTAFKLLALNPDANFIIAPSDAIVLRTDVFTEAMNFALDFTEKNDALCTLGIRPSRPDTGYGYIKYEKKKKVQDPDNDNIGGVHQVIKFTEKPDVEKAREFLASGRFLWNAGIFIWRAASVLKAFQTNAPLIHEILEKGKAMYNTSEEQAFIDEFYPTTPKISVDYAIMEKATNIFTIPVDFGWSDLGTWGSLHSESDQDERQNVVQGDNVILNDVSDSLIVVPKDKLVVLRDLDNYIVVDQDDVLLVYPKSKEQEIKVLTKQLSEKGRGQFL